MNERQMSLDELAASLHKASEQPEPMTGRTNAQRKDNIALDVHMMTVESVIDMCGEMVGPERAANLAICMIEWSIKRSVNK